VYCLYTQAVKAEIGLLFLILLHFCQTTVTNVPELGDITGKDRVWIYFEFLSDNDSTAHGGVFVDDIVLWKRHVEGTPIGGVMKGTMSYANNPYITIGDVGVAEGDTLVTEPRVEILFYKSAEFIQ